VNIKEKTVGKIVEGRPVYFVLESESVLEAARYMTEHQIGAVPVLEKGYEPGVLAQQVGIFSERDLMTRIVAKKMDPASTTVGEVMTRRVAVLREDNTCEEALALMKQLHIRHLPVLVGKEIVGCVSIRDLHEAKVEHREAEIEFLDNYIEKMEEAAWGTV
jgi:CBS domain-containing protein